MKGRKKNRQYNSVLNIDEPLTRIKSDGTIRHYVADALGSVIALTDDTGAVRTTYTYDPFGNVIISGEASDNLFQYTGRENDGTGLYYYRARYYSPDLQRFISEDPIRLAGGDVNYYAYVGNNPVNFIDPMGLHWLQGPFGPIPHRHAGANGPVTVVNPQDSGAWPGSPEHQGRKSGKCLQCDETKLNACIAIFIESDACQQCGNVKNPYDYNCRRCESELMSIGTCYLMHCSRVDCC